MRLIKVPLDYPTLNEAVDAANDGDCIALSSGVHVIVESLILTKRLNIWGEDHEPTIIQLAPTSLAAGRCEPAVIIRIPPNDDAGLYLPTREAQLKMVSSDAEPETNGTAATSTPTTPALRLTTLRIQASAVATACRRTQPPSAPCVIAVESGDVTLDRVTVLGCPDLTGSLHATPGMHCIRVGRPPSSAYPDTPRAYLLATGCLFFGSGTTSTPVGPADTAGPAVGSGRKAAKVEAKPASCGVSVWAGGEAVLRESRVAHCDVGAAISDGEGLSLTRCCFSLVVVGVDASAFGNVDVHQCEFEDITGAAIRATDPSDAPLFALPTVRPPTDDDIGGKYAASGNDPSRTAARTEVTARRRRGGPGHVGLDGTVADTSVTVRSSAFRTCRIGIVACNVRVSVQKCRFEESPHFFDAPLPGAAAAAAAASGATGSIERPRFAAALLAIGRDGTDAADSPTAASTVHARSIAPILSRAEGRLPRTPHPAAALGVDVTHPLIDVRRTEMTGIGGVGTLAIGCAAVRLRGCVLQQCATAVSAEGLGSVVLLDECNVVSADEAAVLVTGGARVGVENSTLRDCNHGGVVIAGSPSVAILRRCSVLRTVHGPGVRAVSGGAAVVVGCTIEQNDRGIVFEPSADFQRSAIVRSVITASRSVGLSAGVYVSDRFIDAHAAAVKDAAANAEAQRLLAGGVPIEASGTGSVLRASDASDTATALSPEEHEAAAASAAAAKALIDDLSISADDQALDPVRSARHVRARTQVAEARAAASAQEELALRELYLMDLNVLFVDVADALGDGGAQNVSRVAGNGHPLVVRQCELVDNGRVGLAVSNGAIVAMANSTLRDNGTHDVRADSGGRVLDEGELLSVARAADEAAQSAGGVASGATDMEGGRNAAIAAPTIGIDTEAILFSRPKPSAPGMGASLEPTFVKSEGGTVLAVESVYAVSRRQSQDGLGASASDLGRSLPAAPTVEVTTHGTAPPSPTGSVGVIPTDDQEANTAPPPAAYAPIVKAAMHVLD